MNRTRNNINLKKHCAIFYWHDFCAKSFFPVLKVKDVLLMETPGALLCVNLGCSCGCHCLQTEPKDYLKEQQSKKITKNQQ